MSKIKKMSTCCTYPLLKHCFYVQTCTINSTGQNCCDTDCCVTGSILIVLSFVGVDFYTDTYYVNYYYVSSTQPPNPIPGVCQKILNNNYECTFNDQSVFQIRFSTPELNIGRIAINTSLIVGDFCILDVELYNSFYSNPTTGQVISVAKNPETAQIIKEAEDIVVQEEGTKICIK
jgi:hypothetical protein